MRLLCSLDRPQKTMVYPTEGYSRRPVAFHGDVYHEEYTKHNFGEHPQKWECFIPLKDERSVLLVLFRVRDNCADSGEREQDAKNAVNLCHFPGGVLLRFRIKPSS